MNITLLVHKRVVHSQTFYVQNIFNVLPHQKNKFDLNLQSFTQALPNIKTDFDASKKNSAFFFGLFCELHLITLRHFPGNLWPFEGCPDYENILHFQTSQTQTWKLSTEHHEAKALNTWYHHWTDSVELLEKNCLIIMLSSTTLHFLTFGC